ncbi:tRNA (N6-threonylcarbamoyladenosine(37)-N6)-methyltransferase TrmO [Sedimentibacter hydroxybenzoicus DSM 7310]|uniref:tRNA (N6-threonylcarbamoyladenosine(37)-N6)-methyltransferase TrmO n=1 Tax=Sedimentibacter hydroxybenzoicus DSM 7310 TaxID=1123245 RepID=A0A974GXG1_SEDHY|nr:tRNA (N6-threonylcarbamoyladenosine(37)-N6)-methyltransferase TrmO [Sedimentibacter hydroxybenzoicus]NYB75025.1 tRNA (N6-threonylcarbamoyladenosine(37)-N6)-methyltransferase TrmO [Sedimentibacter hydroxybenzoicus DSM 7310]
MNLKRIGIVHSIYKEKGDAPRQGKLSNQESTIEIFPEYIDGLDGIEELSHIVVLYWGDRANRETLKSTPPGSKTEKGVFTIRSPHRPNPIALCVCKIISVKENIITVTGLDAFDNSPVLDIKVFVPKIDTDKDYSHNSD